MDALRGKLAVGVSYGEYLHGVNAARSAYREIPAGRVGLGCLLAAGTASERALNRYMVAANAWGECLTEASCGTRAVEPRLQREWARASALLSSARDGL